MRVRLYASQMRLYRGVNAFWVPSLKQYLIEPRGMSSLGRSRIALEQAYRGWTPTARAVA